MLPCLCILRRRPLGVRHSTVLTNLLKRVLHANSDWLHSGNNNLFSAFSVTWLFHMQLPFRHGTYSCAISRVSPASFAEAWRCSGTLLPHFQPIRNSACHFSWQLVCSGMSICFGGCYQHINFRNALITNLICALSTKQYHHHGSTSVEFSADSDCQSLCVVSWTEQLFRD